MTQDARVQLERQLGRPISGFLWNVIIQTDGFYVPASQLKEECRKRGLAVSGSKHVLIYRLLESEFVAAKANQ